MPNAEAHTVDATQPLALELTELDATLLERVLLDWLVYGFAAPGSINHNEARKLMRRVSALRPLDSMP